MKVIDEMVNRFLSWPLPESVCADLIATKQGLGRIGTNLLTANEAKQMLEHVLAAPSPAGPNALAEELETAWEESGFELQNDPLSHQLDAAITRALAALRSCPAQGEMAAPCRHEWYQGECVHCTQDAREFFRTRPAQGRDAVIEECAAVAREHKERMDKQGKREFGHVAAYIEGTILSLKSADAAMSQQEKKDG